MAVLGAGPVGLEAALQVRAAGLPVALFDRGPVADHVGRWGFVRMFTPFGMNTTPLGLTTLRHDAPARELPAAAAAVTGREFREAYLVPLAESSALRGSVHAQTAVVAVGRANRSPSGPFRLLVRGPDGKERIETADVVFDCTGCFSRPHWLGDGGIPAAGESAARPHVSYWPEDVLGAKRGHYAGRSVAVVGAGFTAAATACDLAALAADDPATWVVWLTRGPRGQPLARVPADPLRDRDRLAARANALALRPDGNLEHHWGVALDEVTSAGPDGGFYLGGRANGKPVGWAVDRVIAAVGHRPDSGLTADPPGPGYFVLGAKGRAAGGDFLLADGYAEVRRMVAGLTREKRAG